MRAGPVAWKSRSRRTWSVAYGGGGGSCFAHSAGIRPGRAIANQRTHTDPPRFRADGPRATNLLERRQHLIQTLITHGVVVGPHVTISIAEFSQKLPTDSAQEEEGNQRPRATLGQMVKTMRRLS